jgi:hypothetical protein
MPGQDPRLGLEERNSKADPGFAISTERDSQTDILSSLPGLAVADLVLVRRARRLRGSG